MRKENISNYFWVLLLGLIIHILFEGVFIYMEAPMEIILYNIVSIIVFSIGTIKYFGEDEDSKILFMCFIEVSIFVYFSVTSIGWKYEFQNWLFSITILAITVPFSDKKKFYILSFINILLYLYLYFKTAGQYSVSTSCLNFFIMTNIFGAFFMILFAENLLKWSRIMEQYHYREKLKRYEKIASIDFLTGLYNRHKMKDILELMNRSLTNVGSEFYIAFADIDNFKVINDTYGHDAGDEVLKAASKLFISEIGATDYVARWRGEEFLILLNSPMTRIDAKLKLENIRQKIEALEVPYGDVVIRFTMTFGAVSSKGFKNIYDMNIRADELMYVGKTTGKNKVTMDKE